MSAIDILTSLYESNISLKVCDDTLKIRADKGIVDEKVLASIRANKRELIDLLKDLENKNFCLLSPLNRRFNKSSAPLSFEQKTMLWLDKISETKYHYNMSAAYKLVGNLDRDVLTMAFADLVENHAILRTVYTSEKGRERQNIQTIKPFTIDHKVLKQTSDLNKLLEEHAKTFFDLSHDWPIRVLLITSNTFPNEHYLCITLHHIAADGWSVGIFLRELSKAYNYRLHHNIPCTVDNNCAQYCDYVYWQNDSFNKVHREELLAFWQERLKNLPVLHNLPTDFPRPNKQNFDGAIYQEYLSKSLNERFNLIIKEKNTTSFIVFQCVFAALLKRYTSDEDVVFGTVIANRAHPELMNTIGMFANSLVLRYNVDDFCHFDDLMTQASEVSQAALDHGQLPFDMLVETLQPQRSLAYNPLVQIMLVMQENYHQQLALDGLSSEFIDNDRWVSKFDLSLHLTNRNDRWELRWEYNTSLFKSATIERIHNHFVRMAELLFAHPQQAISELPLVTLQELSISHFFAELPANNCIHSIIENHAATTPEKLAVFSKSQQLNYRQLNERSTYLASRLWRLVEQDNVSSLPFIGVCLERDVDLVVSLLAIFKMGGVYVPIDPAYPEERMGHMVCDSGITLLLTNAHIQKRFKDFDRVTTLTLDTIVDNKNIPLASVTYPSPKPENPAYVIYTSGSTGKPKGVLVSHGSLFQSLHANGKLMNFSAEDTMPCLGSVAFGASLLEILLPLTNGGTAHMLSKSDVADVADLIRYTSRSTTVLHMVPSLMRLWLSSLEDITNQSVEPVYSNLRLVLTGGEAVPKHLLDEFHIRLPHINILGLYGMTEAAIVCFSHTPKNDDDPNHCLGVPHPHMQAFSLNKQRQLQPLGCAGELHLSGASLAQGYLNQKTYTQERFITHSFLELPDQRLYKTGDCARLLDDGRFEFLGRMDNQVSIRGFRIEPGEIESCLRKHPEVVEVLVVERSDSNDHKQLVAYFTTDKALSKCPNTMELQGYLADSLPSHMIPAYFVSLDQFPLNPNGKINRYALPEVNLSKIKESYDKPLSDREKVLTKIWSAVLNVPFEEIGTEDNFFALGGDSILSLKVIEMARSMDIVITPQKFFQYQTIAELANLTCDTYKYEGDIEGPVPLTPTQKSTFCVKKYNENHNHAAIMRDVSNELDAESWFKIIETLLTHHSGLRTLFHYKNKNWHATITSIEQYDFFERIDFSFLDEKQRKSIIDKCTYKTIDISQGPLAKLFLFENKSPGQNAFLFIVHHLVMDRVSLEILSDDFYSLITQKIEKRPLSLPKKTASVHQIVSVIDKFSKSSTLRKDVEYWLSLPWHELTLFPTDFPQDNGPFDIARNSTPYVIELNTEKTNDIIQGLKQFSDISMSDILTLCLVNAFAEWLDRQWIKINVMNNGRTLLPGMEDIDVSRTITLLTLDRVLCLQKTEDVSLSSIQKISEQIQAIPNRGLGYDLLYWVNEGLDKSQKIEFPIHANERGLILNYQGAIEKNSRRFITVKEKGVASEFIYHPNNHRMSQFFADALIVDGKLTICMYYGSNLYREKTTANIMKHVNNMLTQIGKNLRENSEKMD